MSVSRRVRLFEIGAKAIARYTGDDTFYYCPICSQSFTVEDAESGRLTLEHVPPQSQDGKGIILTCKRCNSTAGHTIEAHLDRRDRMVAFGKQMRGLEQGSTPSVHLEVGGHQVMVNVRRAEGLDMETVPKINNPQALDAFYQHLRTLQEDGRWTGTKINLTKRVRLNQRQWKLAHLKSAFLLLTAHFGYRYAFDERLVPVRQQLFRPEDDIIGTRFWIMLEDVSISDRVIVSIDQPKPFHVVFNGKEGVIMPALSSPHPFYNWVIEVLEPRGKVDTTGIAVRWPETMEMFLDFS